MSVKYYAIASGYTPGIYTDWKTAESMVKGFPGAIYKSFRNKTDAENFLMKSNASLKSSVTDKIQVLPLLDKTIAYTDGSFSNGSCGFGVVIIASNGDKITAHGNIFASGKLQLNRSNNVAELYAVYVALSLVKGNIIIYTDSRYVISCFSAYIHTWIENGWNGVANRQLIEPIYQLLIGRNVTFQYVPAHSGHELNEEADTLANQGRLSNEQLIIMKNGNPQI